MEIVWYLIGVLVIVIGLALAIGIHELGHLLPAKLFGVKVTQYMLGFGPTIWSKKKGETEYGVKAVPLGGYVAMIGMYPPKKTNAVQVGSTGLLQNMVEEARLASAESITEGDEHRAFYLLPIWKRIVVMLGGPLTNLIQGLIFLTILLVGFGMPQLSTTVGTVNECVISVNSQQTECGVTDPVAPANAAGLLPGDRVISFAGEDIQSWEQLSALIRETTVTNTIVVERDGQQVSLPITPMVTERPIFDEHGQAIIDTNGDYLTTSVGFLGISSLQIRVPQGIETVIPTAWDTLGQITNVIINLPQRMVAIVGTLFSTEERDPNGPISVVGVGRIAGEVASHPGIEFQEKVAGILGILASLNFALFAFNLIPLPPLDGGHVAGALWEALRRGWAKIRGKPDPGPVDSAKLMPLTMVMFVLLSIMGGLLIIADIIKPVQLF